MYKRQEQANNEGVALSEVLLAFEEVMSQSTCLVGHNINFDEKVLGAEFLRKGFKNDFFDKQRLCTMQSSTQYCQLPGRYGFKWPTLTELHNILFGRDFEDAHDAAGDINATENCFWRLRELRLI